VEVASTLPRLRVALVKPPQDSTFNFGVYSLATLAAAIRDNADVSIFDVTSLPTPQATAAVLKDAPDLIGITVMDTTSAPPAASFVEHLRASQAARRFQIVCGGHGASCLPRPLLEAGADAVAIGEGESTLREVVERGIRPGAAGLMCLRDGRLVAGPAQKLISPLDLLPAAARDLMPAPPDRIHLVETSRGCPHSCAFCEASRFYCNRWRGFSPERTVAEVDRLCGDFGAMIIQLADDNFAADRRRALRICQALTRVRLPALIMLSARADDLLAIPDLLPAMARARMLRVAVGVETLDREAACRIGKPIGLEAYQELFRRMRELGIFSLATFIVGLPGETASQRAQCVNLAVEAGPDSAKFIAFRPLPGVPLSAGFAGLEPRPEDVRDAHAFAHAFYRRPRVRSRLESAARRRGIAGMLARGTLERHAITAPN